MPSFHGDGAGNLTGVGPENAGTVTRGTRIRTPRGETPVQDLVPGDLVMTRDHAAQPVRWIGSSTVQAAGWLAPVVFAAGALDNDHDLRVGQRHRMLITDWRAELMFGEREVLAAAGNLVNGDTIRVVEGGRVEYFHVLLDRHEILSVNGAPSESFHPCERGLGRLDAGAREEILHVFPGLRSDSSSYGPVVRTPLRGYEIRALTR